MLPGCHMPPPNVNKSAENSLRWGTWRGLGGGVLPCLFVCSCMCNCKVSIISAKNVFLTTFVYVQFFFINCGLSLDGLYFSLKLKLCHPKTYI